MKIILLIIFSLSCLNLFAQELNISSSLGYKFIKESQKIYKDEENATTVSGLIEFRPNHAIFSLNAEARCLLEEKTIVQFPIFLKFIIGKKIRFCPSLGAFISTNGNYGMQFGLNLEVPVNEKLILYGEYQIYSEIYEESNPGHFGNESKDKAARGANWVGVGLKYNLL